MTNKYKGWYDVQDSKGVWRLGKCVLQKDLTMLCHIDGWSSKYDTIHCSHSKQLETPRKHSRGLTTQQPHPLREPIEDFKQVTNIHNKLKLLLNSSPETLEVEEIVSMTYSFFRVELLVIVDSILTLPFDVNNDVTQFQNIHQGLEINKFFSNIVTFVSKVLERSSIFLQLGADPKRKALQDGCYQLFIMLRSIFGLNPRHDRFFSNNQNMFIKKQGFIECFLKSQAGGLLLSNSYLKNITAHGSCDIENFETNSELIITIMELYERRLLPEDQNSRLLLFVDTITNYLKCATKNDKVQGFLKTTLQGKYMLNMLENMYIKLKPNKKFQIETIIGSDETKKKKRKESDDASKQTGAQSTIFQQSQYIEKPKPFKKKPQPAAAELDIITQSKSNIINTSKLQQRIAKLESQISQQPKPSSETDLLQQFLKAHEVVKPTDVVHSKSPSDFDFNELAFLNVIQYHMSMNQFDQVTRLVNWRKKVIQLATIVGWDIAKQVAKHTREKLTIETKDILSVNIAYLKKMYSL